MQLDCIDQMYFYNMKILKSYFNDLNMGGNNMKTKKKFIIAHIVFLLSLLLMFGKGFAQSNDNITSYHSGETFWYQLLVSKKGME